ncbi:calcium-transporting ATPase 5, plasma membrane-type [Artemisia annua]|uniref:Calcium-transporting ATPase 5, plasma membrane-type n=1 Tax=Artemisia annua TaxID=35608 RepID=A0A2U1QIX2_ARTAN|nr:calcium-transporting ATPase 5, plasma membrane-type [Artemisia annua]
MAVMIAMVVFQVIIVEFLGTFASTVPFDWQLWVLSIVIGLVSMPIAVILKCIPVEKKRLVSEQHDGYEILPDGPEQRNIIAGKPTLNLHGVKCQYATAILDITFIFTTFVFCQVVNETNSRNIDKINIFRGMFSSWIFMAVMIAMVVFQVIIVEFLGTFASTVPLDWQLWVLSIVIGLVSMPIAVILKCIPVEK